MARKQHPECSDCTKRWIIDVDISGEYGAYRLYGCTQPAKRRFEGVSKYKCAHYSRGGKYEILYRS